MDPNAAPWRALDAASATGDDQPPEAGRPLPLAAIGAGLGAVVLAIVAFLLAFGSGGGDLQLTGGALIAPSDWIEPDAGGPADRTEVVVEIVGAIARPGVYRLAAGARVGDLVREAGGFGPRVDVDRATRELNLAAPLEDGDQVRVPSRDDASPTAPSVAGGSGPDGGSGADSGAWAGEPIDLNTATAAELESLPGIGPVTAGKIIAAREEQPFASVDDLRSRSVLGEKTFEKIRDLVAVP